MEFFNHKAHGVNKETALKVTDHEYKAQMLMQQQKYQDAQKELHSSLDCKRQISARNDKGISISTLLLADAYLGSNNFEEAMKYCEETMEIRTRINDPDLIFAHQCFNRILRAERLYVYGDDDQKLETKPVEPYTNLTIVGWICFLILMFACSYLYD